MADFVQITQYLYVGAASDTKPSVAETGARAYETDTRKWFITYDGGIHWAEVPGLTGLAGLAYIGTVSTATDTTHFKASNLGGYGDAYFKNWTVYPLWDADGAGAAPQNEYQTASAYTSTDGSFTHGAFSAQLAVGDKILLLHPTIAALANSTYGLSNIQTLVAAIKTKTDNLPAAPADNVEVQTVAVAAGGGSVATLTRLGLLVRWMADILNNGTNGLAAIRTLLDTIAGYIDTEVSAIKTATDKLASASPVTGASASTNWNTGTGTSGESGADLVTIGGAGTKQKLVKLLINVANCTSGSVVEVRLYDQANSVAGKRLAYSQVRLTPAQGTQPDIIDIIAQTGGPIELDNAMRIEVYSSTNEFKVLNYEYRLELR